MGHTERIRIVVAEPDARRRNHLLVLLGEPPLHATLEAHAVADSALQSLPGFRPELLVLGFDAARAGHAEIIFRFKSSGRHLRIVACGVPEDSQQVLALLAAGADAVVSRADSSLKLIEAIESVRRGQAFLSADLARTLVESLRRTEALRRDLDGLSRRELDVLQLLATGSTDQEIARRLGIAPRTVGTHLQHIYKKIDVHSRAAAVAKYLVGSGHGLNSALTAARVRPPASARRLSNGANRL